MKNLKSLASITAFTLLELIIVVLITAILAAYIFSRPDSSNSYQQDTVIEQVISAGRLAQQLHMNDTSRSFSLLIQSNQITLLDYTGGTPGNSISAGLVSFPLVFDSKITLSPASTIIFDRLGGITVFTSISVAVIGAPNKSVCFETSGYIHRC
jgi:prepilin-type N-terminal cleavage/methylation domain-containing protein